MSRKRNWCFTLNNLQQADRDFWEDLEDWQHENLVVYAVGQEEKGEHGTPHLQGYIEMKKATRMSRMKSLFGKRYHWEVRRGTQAQAILYCKKEDTRVENGFSFEYGTAKRSTAGGNFTEVALAMKDGMSIVDAEEQYPVQFAMHPQKLQAWGLKQLPSRDWAMEIEIFYGKTGTGKSDTAKTENPLAYECPWPKKDNWWMYGYTGQYCMIMDDFMHQIKLGQMMKIMDRGRWQLEAKGSNFDFASHKIVITTNIDPVNWYPKISEERKKPLQRRIREFAKIYDFEEGHAHPDFVKVLRTREFTFAGMELAPGLGGYAGNFGRNM